MELSNQWLDQFIGLWMGEGTITIHPTNKGTYCARLSITLRQDDEAVMREIHSKLGGYLRLDPKRLGSNPQWRWETNKQLDIEAICLLIRSRAILPAKKLKELDLVLEFIAYRKAQPYHLKDWTRAAKFRDDLLAIRAFKVAE